MTQPTPEDLIARLRDSQEPYDEKRVLVSFDALWDVLSLQSLSPIADDHIAGAGKLIRDGRLAGIEEAARVAYRVCAETRHVTLGDKVSEAILALKSSPPAEGGDHAQ